jgi:hypothetical protein
LITRIAVTLSEVEMHLFYSKMSNISLFSWASLPDASGGDSAQQMNKLKPTKTV